MDTGAAFRNNSIAMENSNQFHDSFCFLGGSDGKESAYNALDPGPIPRLGRSPGGRHGNPLQYSIFLPGESPWTEEPGGLQFVG